MRHRLRHAGLRAQNELCAPLPSWEGFTRALGKRMVPWAPLSFTVLALASMWRCSCPPSRVLGFACTNTEFTRVRHRLRHAGLRAQNELCAPLPSWEGFARALGKRMVPWAPLSFTVLALASMWRCSCPPSRVLGFACTNTEFTRVRHRLRHAGLRAQNELCAPLPSWEGFTRALGKRMVPWAPLSFTVLALASMWRCSCPPSRVLGFACTNTEFTRVRHRLRHAGLRAQNELCAPLPSWEGFTRALGKRMVPWAPLSFTVLALASMWRCSCPPSRVLGFACTNTEFTRVRHRLRHAGLRAQNELCAPLPSWEGFTRALGKRMVPWAPLSFTVLALASMWRCSCSPSRVLGFACTNTEFTRVRHRLRHAGLRAQNELCAPLPSWEGFARALGKRMVPWAPLSFTVLALASMWRCSCPPSRVLGFACTNTELTRVRHRLRHAGLRAQNELCAPLPSWEGFTRALGKRMVPWAPLSFTVLALASMWRCSCRRRVYWVSRAPTPNSRECATACATLG